MDKKILVVDDEKLIVKGIRFGLETEGYEVDMAYDGLEALKMTKSGEYNVLLLDVMLPGMSGFELCTEIRKFSNVPIIMLTAKGSDEDKIMGLECGADDYITKPFNIQEVKARIKAILRREEMHATEVPDKEFSYNGLRISYSERNVYVDEVDVGLTSREFSILNLLVTNPGKVFSREDILEQVWGSKDQGDERTVDVHVRRLREKIEPNSAEPKYVLTKWGVGYYFKQD